MHLDTCNRTDMSDHFVKSYPQRTQTSHSKTANATCIRDAIPSMVRVGTAAAEDNQFSDSAWTPQKLPVFLASVWLYVQATTKVLRSISVTEQNLVAF